MSKLTVKQILKISNWIVNENDTFCTVAELKEHANYSFNFCEIKKHEYLTNQQKVIHLNSTLYYWARPETTDNNILYVSLAFLVNCLLCELTEEKIDYPSPLVGHYNDLHELVTLGITLKLLQK